MISEFAKINYIASEERSDNIYIGAVFEGYAIKRRQDELILQLWFLARCSTEIMELSFNINSAKSLHKAMANALPYLGQTLAQYDKNEDGSYYAWLFGDERKGFSLYH